MKKNILKITLSICGIVIGYFLYNLFTIGQFRPSNYIPIHDNRGSAKIENLFIIIGGIIFAGLMLMMQINKCNGFH